MITVAPTKLFNRWEIIRGIEEEHTRFERNNKQFALIMADIDHFLRALISRLPSPSELLHMRRISLSTS